MNIVAGITALVELIKLIKGMFVYLKATFGDDYIKVIKDLNEVFANPPKTSAEKIQNAKDIQALIKRM